MKKVESEYDVISLLNKKKELDEEEDDELDNEEPQKNPPEPLLVAFKRKFNEHKQLLKNILVNLVPLHLVLACIGTFLIPIASLTIVGQIAIFFVAITILRTILSKAFPSYISTYSAYTADEREVLDGDEANQVSFDLQQLAKLLFLTPPLKGAGSPGEPGGCACGEAAIIESRLEKNFRIIS